MRRFPLKRMPSSAPKGFTEQAAPARPALWSPIGQSPRGCYYRTGFVSADDALGRTAKTAWILKLGATRIARYQRNFLEDWETT